MREHITADHEAEEPLRESPQGDVVRREPSSLEPPSLGWRLPAADEGRVSRRAEAPSGSSDLIVGPADDPAEREADRVANEVVGKIRRRAADEHPELAADVRRSAEDGGSRVARSSGREPVPEVGLDGGALDSRTSREIGAARLGGRSLDGDVRHTMEGAFGADFSRVRVHDDHRATDLSERIQARAFTVGSDIFFNGRAPDASQPSGQQLLAHELAHTLQQGEPASAQRTIRRLSRYLDGVDWVAGTPNTGLIKGNRRKTAMKAIDAAVAVWARDWGDVPAMILATQGILDAISNWEHGKKNHNTAMRGSEVADLKAEATFWNSEAKRWKVEHAQRQARHLQDRQTVSAWIDEGLAQDADARLHNACEWVRTGRTAFYVVTETADQFARAAAKAGKWYEDIGGDTRCYYPNPTRNVGAVGAPAVTYNADDLTDNNIIDVDDDGAGTKGWNRAGSHIVVTEEGVQDGKAKVFGTLRHEVQHDADKNRGEELNAGVVAAEATGDDARIQSATALRRYKTEYRAHFYQGDPRFDTKAQDPANRVTHEGYQWTERQWEILQKIRRCYGYVKTAWGENAPTPLQLAYRTAVVVYWNPDTEGFNKYDSIRVDDLYKALALVPDGTADPGDPTMAAVLGAADNLDRGDIAYLQDPNESVMFRGKINRHLAGPARAAIESAMEDRDEDLAGGELADWLESVFG